MTFTVYRIACSANGKSYVGRTTDAARRKRQHFQTLRTGTHRNAHLQAAFNLYGEAAFRWEEIEQSQSLDALRIAEQFFLDRLWKLDALFNLSNDSSGGSGKGRVASPETRARMSAARKAYLSDPAVRASLADKRRGKVLSAEHRAKLSAAHKGKTLTAEHRANMRAAQLRRYAAK